MNTKILQKCLEELKAEKPRIDYVCGMLETLIEMQQNNPIQTIQDIPRGQQINPPIHQIFAVATNGDESVILDARARDALNTVKELEKNGTIATEQP